MSVQHSRPDAGTVDGEPPSAADAWLELRRPTSTGSAAWELLLRVARDIPARHPHVACGLLTEQEITQPLVRLCAGVRDALDGRAPEVGDSQALLPLRPLLDALRRGLLDGLDGMHGHGAHGDGVDGELIPLLRALELVHASLEEDSAQRFAERLAEGDAMNLVVEVAHDMRSPLGSILFLVERLRRAQSGPVNAVQERQLGLIYSAAFGLSTLASDVMELARGGDRLVHGDPVAFSVQEIFQQVHDIVVPMAEEKQLELRMEPPEGDWRVGYPQALQRTLLNLVTNSLKFTNDGSVTLCANPVDRARMEFVVADTGRGMPPHVIATLFDPFRRRQHPGDYAFSSAGLGLSICRKLIAGMGSELVVESELEVGTRFSFVVELPAARTLGYRV